MAQNSSIEWTEATWNPIAGCTPVSPGCLHCYAATMSHRLQEMGQEKYRDLTVLRNGIRTFNGKINLDEAALSIPLKRKKPTMYFVNSMSDLFHENVPRAFVNRVFGIMEHAQQHTYQVLTKRASAMTEYICWRWGGGRIPCHNIWLGTSVEGRDWTHRIESIREMPARVRFLSIEPLLDDIGVIDPRGIHWVIVGGESGPKARPCSIEWVRSIVAQCQATGVACFVKQLGGHVLIEPDSIDTWGDSFPDHDIEDNGMIRVRLKDPKGGDPSEWPDDLRVREFPISALDSRQPQPATEARD